jgi:hypothetical protein
MPQLRRGDLVIYDGYYAVVRDVTLTRVELRLANGLVIDAQDIIQQLDMRTGHRPLESVASFHEEMRPYDSWHYLKPEITHAITEELLTRAHRGIIATKLRDNSIKTQCKAGMPYTETLALAYASLTELARRLEGHSYDPDQHETNPYYTDEIPLYGLGLRMPVAEHQIPTLSSDQLRQTLLSTTKATVLVLQFQATDSVLPELGGHQVTGTQALGLLHLAITRLLQQHADEQPPPGDHTTRYQSAGRALHDAYGLVRFPNSTRDEP